MTISITDIFQALSTTQAAHLRYAGDVPMSPHSERSWDVRGRGDAQSERSRASSSRSSHASQFMSRTTGARTPRSSRSLQSTRVSGVAASASGTSAISTSEPLSNHDATGCPDTMDGSESNSQPPPEVTPEVTTDTPTKAELKKALQDLHEIMKAVYICPATIKYMWPVWSDKEHHQCIIHQKEVSMSWVIEQSRVIMGFLPDYVGKVVPGTYFIPVKHP